MSATFVGPGAALIPLPCVASIIAGAVAGGFFALALPENSASLVAIWGTAEIVVILCVGLSPTGLPLRVIAAFIVVLGAVVVAAFESDLPPLAKVGPLPTVPIMLEDLNAGADPGVPIVFATDEQLATRVSFTNGYLPLDEFLAQLGEHVHARAFIERVPWPTPHPILHEPRARHRLRCSLTASRAR